MPTDSPSESIPQEGRPLESLKVGREERTMRLLAKVLQGLANPLRLSIVLLLARQGELRVTELVERLRTPQPQISAQLRFLGWCGCVQSRKEGRNVYYCVADERVMQMVALSEAMLRDRT